MMQARFASRQARWLLAGILLGGLALRLAVAWQPVGVILTKSLADDGFYYFMLAHHTAQTGSVSLDGIHLTNGFHPLWWLLLIPFFGGQMPLGEAPIHAALTLAALFDLVSIWCVAHIALRLANHEGLGLLAALVYAANPMVVLQVNNGLETALATALLLLFWWLYIRLLHHPADWRLTFAMAGVAGLAIMARSDSAVYIALSFAGLLLVVRDAAGWRRLISAGGVVAALAAPFFLWSQATLGVWFQDSGLAVPLASRARLELQHGSRFAVVLEEAWRQLTAPAMWLRGDPTGLPLVLGVGLWVAVVAGLIVRWRRAPNRVELLAIVPMLTGGAILFLVHAGVRWYPRMWYFTPLAAVFAVCLAVVGHTLARRRRLMFATLVGFFTYFAIAGYILWVIGLYPWQQDMRAASAWIGQNVEPGANVGSFNSGIYAYYSGRRVVNLDGVANHAAFQAVKRSELIRYMEQAQISYLVDYDYAIHTEYAQFMGPGYPEALNEIEVLGGTTDSPLGLLRVYRLASGPAR